MFVFLCYSSCPTELGATYCHRNVKTGREVPEQGMSCGMKSRIVITVFATVLLGEMDQNQNVTALPWPVPHPTFLVQI